ncbi:MAG: hypothetical protein QM679_11835 [Patulibacter sp.]
MPALLLPLIAAPLWYGLGALVAWGACRLAPQATIPRAFWPALGVALTAILVDGISRLGLPFPTSLIVLVGAGAAGLWLHRAALAPSRSGLLLAGAAALPALTLYAAITVPIGATLTGYLADTNTGVHALGADYLVHRGGDFAAISGTTSDVSMIRRFFVASSYPSGTHAVLGALGSLTGSSLLELNSPLMLLMLIVTALSGYGAARALAVRPAPAAFGGAVGSCGALLFAFALTGQLKELVTAPQLLALVGLVLWSFTLSRREALRNATIWLPVLAASLYCSLNIAAMAWIGTAGIFVLAYGIAGPSADGEPRIMVRPALRALVVMTALSALLTAPLLPHLAGQLNLAGALSQSNTGLANDPGNLTGPIGKDRAFGIWLAPDHRSGPAEPGRNSALIGAAAMLVLLGGASLLVRRRSWQALWFAVLGAVWLVLTQRGTMWLDSKLVALYSPIVALLAAAGVDALSRTWPGRQGAALATIAVLPTAAGVIVSDYYLTRATTTAPMQRYRELSAIDREFRGHGPVLFTEFDEYALYSLRHVHASGPGYAEWGGLSGADRDGTAISYGHSVDIDRISRDDLAQFPLIVTLRSPQRSAPPSNYRLVRHGALYDVWQRQANPAALRHFPVSGDETAIGSLSCSTANAVIAAARRSGGRIVVRDAPGLTQRVDISHAQASPNWAATLPGVNGAGRLTVPVPKAARTVENELWISVAVGRPLRVYNNNQREQLGLLPRRAGGDGTAIGPVRVPAGNVRVLLVNTARQLRAGDKAPSVMQSAFFVPAGQAATRTISAAQLRERCEAHAPVDWIDVVR